MVLDEKVFYHELRTSGLFARMSQSQVDGVNCILDAWDKYAPRSDPRFICYSLGTVYHECDQLMQPVEEYGKGRGKPYGIPSGPYHQIYYGRGFVQLTWQKNYEFADRRLRELGVLKSSDDHLDAHAEMVSEPGVASAVLVFGMLEGWFTHKKLADFFRGTRSDWVDARSIINGKDKAALVAGYSLKFYHALTEASAST